MLRESEDKRALHRDLHAPVAHSAPTLAGLAIWLVAAAAGNPAPRPDAPLPRDPPAIAAALVRTHAELVSGIDGWLKAAKPSPDPPAEVTLNALYEQRIYRMLSRHDGTAAATFGRLPGRRKAAARDVVAALRELFRLTRPISARAIRTGPAEPAGTLLGYYREGERSFGIPWRVLAAVNFVESAFGKMRSRSASGAQGPMQFMPATWRVYGLGGDIHDPHDAILGAANYLRVSGGARNLGRALHAYNPAAAYVDAILRFARRLGADRRAFFELYSWQVFVRTPQGDRRVTGPGLPR